MSKLYEHTNYLNKNIDCLIGTRIIEYDIVSAGYNMIREYKLLDSKYIKILSNMDKKKRHIYIGKLTRDVFPELQKEIEKCIEETRKKFFESNKIEDYQVISIKKDAIIITTNVINLKFGKYIEFIPKNRYTSYYYINKKEFYYHSGIDDISVKGISDETLELHKNGILMYLKDIFKYMEKGRADTIVRKIRKFRDDYLEKKLEIECYRELSLDSVFRIVNDKGLSSTSIGLEDVSSLEYVDILYNYKYYIVPLINIILSNTY